MRRFRFELERDSYNAIHNLAAFALASRELAMGNEGCF